MYWDQERGVGLHEQGEGIAVKHRRGGGRGRDGELRLGKGENRIR